MVLASLLPKYQIKSIKIALVVRFYQFTEVLVGVAEFKNKLYLHTIVRHIASKFEGFFFQ